MPCFAILLSYTGRVLLIILAKPRKTRGVVMNQVSLVICFIMIVLFGSSNAYSSDIQGSPAPFNSGNMGYETTPVHKLGRGVANILTFYLEIPASELRAGECHHDTFAAFLTGTFQGIFTALYRGLTGVCDVITFFAPPYDKPLMEPEYAEESLSKETRD
jgi:putative exosortase-associated protein (TIGR04073 family)